MQRSLLATLLFILALPLAAAEVRELTWSEMVPDDAPVHITEPAPMHDLSQLADALAESRPAAMQQSPNAPVVQALNGQSVKLPGYIVPLDVTEEGRVTDPYFMEVTADGQITGRETLRESLRAQFSGGGFAGVVSEQEIA